LVSLIIPFSLFFLCFFGRYFRTMDPGRNLVSVLEREQNGVFRRLIRTIPPHGWPAAESSRRVGANASLAVALRFSWR
jgi:hypothetical protein